MAVVESAYSPQYTEALAHGGALIEQMRTLSRAWRPGESTPDFIRRVREEDILGHATARTVSDYVRVFARRFVVPPGPPVRHLQRLLEGTGSRQIFTDLALYYTAEQDDLLRDFTVLGYWMLVREGRLWISREDARRFIREAEDAELIRAPWSEPVKRDMPMRLLNALADFGLLGALKIGRRPVAPFRPEDGTLVYLAYLLHLKGTTDAGLADQAGWRLFGLLSRDVWHRLEQLSGQEWFLIQRAGDVVRISWRYARIDEVVDALAG